MTRPSLVLSTLALGLVLGCRKTPPPQPPAAPTPPPAAPAPTAKPQPAAPSEYDRVRGMGIDGINRLALFGDIHFDFDKADVRKSDHLILRKNADALKTFDFLDIRVEGHCDERGTAEYNLALGERRARAAHDHLVALGVPASRLKTVSYGKESPLCSEHTEPCWTRNRRVHFTVTSKTPAR